MIEYNPIYKRNGSLNGAITTAPSNSLIFDLAGKAIWAKGVKLKGTDHTYTFSHDNYITLTNTPGSDESEDIKIGVNITTLKAAIDTTYSVVKASSNGLAPMFSSGNLADTDNTDHYYLGIKGSTLKWYKNAYRQLKVGDNVVLGVTDRDPLQIVSADSNLSVSWNSTNKLLVIKNEKPAIGDLTDINVSQFKVTDNTNYRLLFKGTANDNNYTGVSRFSEYLLFNPSTKLLTINGNRVITAVDVYIGATSEANATIGLVPAATSAQRNYYLRGDGTWLTIVQENTWRPIKVNSSEKLGSGTDTGAVDFVAGTGIQLGWDVTNKKITITNSAPDLNHNTDYTTINKGTAGSTTEVTQVKALSSAGVIFEGGTNKFKVGDGTNYFEIPIGTSAESHTHALSIAADSGTSSIVLAASTKYKLTAGGSTYVFTSTPDEKVRQVPKTDNVNRPLMMINGGTTAGELTSTSMFSTGIYANANSKMITTSGFIKTGYDDTSVLLAGGGAKALSDFSTSNHNHDGIYLKYAHIRSLPNKDLNYAIGMYGTTNYGDDNSLLNAPGSYGVYLSLGDNYNVTDTNRNLTAQIWFGTLNSGVGNVYYRIRNAGTRPVSDIGSWKLFITSDNIGSQSVSNATTINNTAIDALLTSAVLGKNGNNTTLSVTVGGHTETGSVIVPYSENSDKIDGEHLSRFYKHATAFSCGRSNTPWYLVALFKQSIASAQINTSISFYVSEFYYAISHGILNIRARYELGSTTPSFIDASWSLACNIDASNFIITHRASGSDITINLYCYRSGWSSYAFRKLEELNWGNEEDTWLCFTNQYNTNGYASIPSGETLKISVIKNISNAAPASDVYAWAKASSKPTYDWTEILNRPNIPTVNNGNLYLLASGVTKTTFTANQSGNSTFNIAEGTTNGTISVGGVDVSVHGLGSRAYDSTEYLPLSGETLDSLTFGKGKSATTSPGWFRIWEGPDTWTEGKWGIINLFRSFENRNSENITFGFNTSWCNTQFYQIGASVNSHSFKKVRVLYKPNTKFYIEVYTDDTNNGMYVNGIGSGRVLTPTKVSNSAESGYTLSEFDLSSSNYMVSNGFKKIGSSSEYLLLGDGGHKKLDTLSASNHSHKWSEITDKPAAVGGNSNPVYWTGSGFTSAGAYPTKASWNYDDVYVKKTQNISIGGTNVNVDGGSISIATLEYNLRKYLVGGFGAYGGSARWYCVSEMTVGTSNNVTATYMVTGTHGYAGQWGILVISSRLDSLSPNTTYFKCILNNNLDLSHFYLSYKVSGSNVIFKLYVYSDGWTAYEVTRLSYTGLAIPVNETFTVHTAHNKSSGYSSVPISGETGIGNPTNDNHYATNYYTTSDRSKKQNIFSFSEHIRKFQLKDTEKYAYGVIAQEVEEMFRDGEEGNMTVNYNSILSFYIGQLENKVKILEERIKRLESK